MYPLSFSSIFLITAICRSLPILWLLCFVFEHVVQVFLLWTRPYRPNRLASWCFFMIQRFMITYSCHSPKSLRSKELKYLNYVVSRLDEERRWKFAYFWRNYMARGGEWRRRRRIISRRRIKWRRRVEGNELKARQKADLKSGKYSLYLAKDRGRRWLLEPISSLRIRNSRTRVVLSLTHRRLVGHWLMRLRGRLIRTSGHGEIWTHGRRVLALRPRDQETTTSMT